MARSFQITNIFQRLSAWTTCCRVRSKAGLRHNLLRRPHRDRALMERSEEILERVGLAAQRHTRPRSWPTASSGPGDGGHPVPGAQAGAPGRAHRGNEPPGTEEAIAMIRRVTSSACVIIEPT